MCAATDGLAAEPASVELFVERSRIAAPADAVFRWHERVGERMLTVRVEAGQTATVNLTVPVEDQP